MPNNLAVSVTADITDLTAKMLQTKVALADMTKAAKDAARQLDDSSPVEARANYLQLAEGVAQLTARQTDLARQMASSRNTVRETTVSAGQQQFAMRDLSAQMQDLGVGFSMAAQSGEPFKMALMVITQQSSQVISAIQLMRGEAGGFIGFLGGPWGAAIMAAGSILANLAVAHMGASKAADEQKNAEDDLSRALDVLHDRAVQATRSTQDGIQASIADSFAKRRQAEETLKAAEAELALARAKGASAGSSVGSGAPSYFNTFQVGEQAKQESLARDAQAQIDKARANIQKGTESIRGFQAELGKILINQQFDAGAAITARYSQRVSELAKQYREGTLSLQDYTNAVRAARAEEEAAKAAEKTRSGGRSRGGSRATSGSNDNGREMQQQLSTLAAEWREELQARAAINRQEQALAEDQARTDIELSRIALQSKMADLEAEQRAGALHGQRAVQMRAEVNRQLLTLDQELEQRVYTARLAELQKDRTNYARGTRDYVAYNRQIEVLEQQHLNRMTVLKAQADARMRQSDRVMNVERNRQMQGMAGTWAQNLARMATLQQGFSATVSGLWQGIVNVVAGVIEQMLQKWIVAQLIKIGLIKTEHATSVQAQASLAGAGGVASMAAAPFPINTTAPAFGAAMYGAAAAFGMAGFAKGTNELPGDMIAQIHAGERIVPQADNRALLELTRRGAGIVDAPGTRGRGGAAGDGDRIELHFHAAVVNGSREMKRFAERNAPQLAAAAKHYARNGGR
jgi:hypothetical protein